MTNLTNQTAEASSVEEAEYLNSQKMSPIEYKQRVQALEVAIEGSEAAVRLFNDKDFKRLILEDYFIQEPARIAGMLASPKMISDENRQILTEDLIGIGKLKNMLSMVTQNGHRAVSELAELKEYVSVHGLRQ